MMNGSGGGYEYITAAYGNASNSATATAVQPAGQQPPSAGYHPAHALSPAGGPGFSVYDPAVASQQNAAAAAQHQLFMAYFAANYADSQQQQIQHQQHIHNHSDAMNASNAVMAAFLGGAPSAGAFSAVSSFASGSGADLSPLPYTHQQLQPSSRQSSFDDLLFLPQQLQSSPLGSSIDPLYFPMSSTTHADPLLVSSNNSALAASHQHEGWLDEIQLEVSSLSLEPMSGSDVVNRLREKMNEVVTKYIPCVDFLVQCQQDLRKGLDFANNQKRYGGRNSRGMPARQFYTLYIDPLARTFYAKNQGRMEHTALSEAYQGLEKLQHDSKNSERQGCEAVKNAFLGGMKDGESWGLRKWLSKHGSALTVCTDLECILHACQKLDRTADRTKKLSAMLRPMAKQVLNRLQTDIPASYQQHSTAHPYLPFFHRLESALRGMSNFDPEDDDVICLDSDSEGGEDGVPSQANVKPPAAPKRKRSSETKIHIDESIRQKKRVYEVYTENNSFDDESSSGQSASESVVEIVDAKIAVDDWTCPSCSMANAASSTSCLACGEESILKDLVTFPGFDDFFNKAGTPASLDSGFLQQDSESELNGAPTRGVAALWPVPLDQPHVRESSARLIADNLDKLAIIFDLDHQAAVLPAGLPLEPFWEGRRYASALRLYTQLLRMPEAVHFLEPVDEGRLVKAGNDPLFSHVVKHPLSFRQIAQALLGENLQYSTGTDGSLHVQELSSWNMWLGKDLLQAIDLVFLNTLAYGNALQEGKSQHRSLTNKVRKWFWNGITEIVRGLDSELRRQCMPIRRSEKSGFVVYKIDER